MYVWGKVVSVPCEETHIGLCVEMGWDGWVGWVGWGGGGVGGLGLGLPASIPAARYTADGFA